MLQLAHIIIPFSGATTRGDLIMEFGFAVIRGF
jgi:hypothetical protein